MGKRLGSSTIGRATSRSSIWKRMNKASLNGTLKNWKRAESSNYQWLSSAHLSTSTWLDSRSISKPSVTRSCSKESSSQKTLWDKWNIFSKESGVSKTWEEREQKSIKLLREQLNILMIMCWSHRKKVEATTSLMLSWSKTWSKLSKSTWISTAWARTLSWRESTRLWFRHSCSEMASHS